MSTTFQAHVAHGVDDGIVMEYTPDASAVFMPGDLVYMDTATHTVKICGADPSLVLGISEVDSATYALMNPNGKVPIRVLSPSTIVAMPVAGTPTINDEFATTNYGVVKASSGIWQVDLADTTNDVVSPVRVDATNGIYYCRFLAAVLQADAVVA